MVTVVLDGDRQTCAVKLGLLVVPQFADKTLLKKQIADLLKNENQFEEKLTYVDSRKEKNSNLRNTKKLHDDEFKKPKRTNANDGKPQPQQIPKAEMASSNQLTSASETKTTNSMTTLLTSTQTIPETDPQIVKNPKTKSKWKTKKTLERDEKIQPHKKPKLDITNHSSSAAHLTTATTLSSTTTTLTTLPQATPKTAPQFIKDHYETSDLELMYSKFELITNRIYSTSFESCFSRLKHLLQNDLVEYIALDCEMTGLYTVADDERHSLSTGTVFKDNTKQIMDGAKVNSIFQLGLVIKVRQGGWSTWTFHTAPELTKESFTPSTFKFLFENPIMEKHP